MANQSARLPCDFMFAFPNEVSEQVNNLADVLKEKHLYFLRRRRWGKDGLIPAIMKPR